MLIATMLLMSWLFHARLFITGGTRICNLERSAKLRMVSATNKIRRPCSHRDVLRLYLPWLCWIQTSWCILSPLVIIISRFATEFPLTCYIIMLSNMFVLDIYYSPLNQEVSDFTCTPFKRCTTTYIGTGSKLRFYYALSDWLTRPAGRLQSELVAYMEHIHMSYVPSACC